MRPKRSDNELENWDLFVLRHQNLNNVRWHVISAAMFWFGPALGIFVHPGFWLLFFISGFFGAFGHFLFKDSRVDGREATSSVEVVYFSTLMCFLFLKGDYQNEITRVSKKFQRYLNGEISSIAEQSLFRKLGNKEVSV
jgi:hypothetical protein